MPLYTMAEDGNNAWEEITAKDLDDAKQQLREWAADSDWNMDTYDSSTIQVDYQLYEGRWEPGNDADPVYEYTHTFEPTAPDCTDGREHDWIATVEHEGGLAENPGVQGHGGGVIIHDHCKHCGVQRTQDTWAQNPSTGAIMDCTVVSYAEAPDDWIPEEADD